MYSKVIEEFTLLVDSLQFKVLRVEQLIHLDMRGCDGVENNDPHHVRFYDFYLGEVRKGRAFSRHQLDLAVEAYCLEVYNTGEYPDLVVCRRGNIYGRYRNIEVLLCST
jgi:hypothetical protein